MICMDDREVESRLRMMTKDQLGRFGESVVKNIFRASRVALIPLADISNGSAPMIDDGQTKTILPDFDCATADWAAYVDSKCKMQSILFRKKNQIRHGINRKNYEAYKRAAEQFRKLAAVFIVELYEDCGQWSGSLLIERLDALGLPYPGIPGSDQEHMVYWQQKMFATLDVLAPQELWDVAIGKKVDSYRGFLDRVFIDPPKQKGLFD